MKLFMYVSQVVKLSQLNKILVTAKNYNRLHDITGVMSYNRGCYLQVIEGNSENVTSLMQSIRQDTRHTDVCMVLEIEIDRRYFNDWSMHLEPNLQRCHSFLELLKDMDSELSLLSVKQAKLLDIFYHGEYALNNIAMEENTNAPLTYSIKDWPNFSKIEPSPKLLSLCGVLLNNPTRFKDLVGQKIYESDNQLKVMLKQLKAVGCLTVSYEQSNHNVHEIGFGGGRPSFVDRMRNFLQLRMS